MFRKAVVLFLTVAMMLSMVTTVGATENDRVEIQFCVGDETLTINGNAVTVEKPYVVGEGVTLVPLRVITEAFGATVEWVEETQTIKLKYPDVDIVLQIGNPIAEVNGKSETLLAAPELPRDSTMVPLRFISENFGATVSYDEATERITVVKETVSDTGLVEGRVENKFVGDSYYKWSVENPKDMTMSERSFDGTYTLFSYDENYGFDVSVDIIDEDYNFDKSFNDWKNSFKSVTLVKADKDASNEKKKVIHIQGKTKTSFYDVYEIVTENYIYTVSGIFSNDETEIKNEGLRIMSTFEPDYYQEDIHDISNVKDGVRRFESEEMKMGIDIPASYVMVSDEEIENELDFISYTKDDEESRIRVAIYSKSSEGNAMELAVTDFDRNKEHSNSEVVKFDSGVSQNSYNNLRTTEYSYTVKTANENEYNRDIFFELGDYVYNVHFIVKLPNEDKEKFVRSIMNSIEVEEIDFEEVGMLIRNYSEPDGTFKTSDMTGCSLEFPNSYMEYSASSDGIIYTDGATVFAGGVYSDRTYNLSDAKSFMRAYEKNVSQNGGTIKTSTSDVKISGMSFVTMIYKAENEGGMYYGEIYVKASNSRLYIFEARYTERGYSEAARGEVKKIIESAVFE